jgi:hypothetical protein
MISDQQTLIAGEKFDAADDGVSGVQQRVLSHCMATTTKAISTWMLHTHYTLKTDSCAAIDCRTHGGDRAIVQAEASTTNIRDRLYRSPRQLVAT